jgi:hypothetical protein
LIYSKTIAENITNKIEEVFMKKKLFFYLGLTTACIGLTGCASYRAAPLNPLYISQTTVESSTETKANDSILVVARAFDRNDCKRFLDRDVLKKGFQPVQLYIENNSCKSFLFSLDRISLPFARPEEVAHSVHTSTVGRALGYGIPGLLIAWPLIIPAVIDGLKSSEANEALDTDFYHKTASSDRIINPHSHFNRILFVPAGEYQPNFIVTLIDQESKKEKTFAITAN